MLLAVETAGSIRTAAKALDKTQPAVTKALSIEFAVQSLAGMPLHPGAERYYREVGASK
ncbi:LysR family transcriptional regulator [Antarctobacter jejuensis]|uniref:LysR family transcriptional regulator n=1 Tax=Antarctobacter jejuensis TaxID=1439938 RepID=UPI003FD362B0